MRDRLNELGTDTEVVLVTFTTPERVDAYIDRTELPFTVLLDPDRASYRAYGLGRGSVTRVWGWRAAVRYWEIIRRGALGRLHKPTEDSLQLGGDFVIGPTGTLAWGFWSEGPDDRPSVDQLIAAVDAARE